METGEQEDIETGENKGASKSSMSKFTDILVKCRYLPLKPENKEHTVLRLRNGDVFLSFLLYVVCFLILYILCSVLFYISIPNPEIIFATVDMTDFLTQTGFSVSNFLLYPFLPLVLARAASLIPELSLHSTLPWPRIGWKVVVCECLTCAGYLLNIGPTYLHLGREALQHGSLAVYISAVLAAVVTAYVVFCFLSSQLLILSWIEHLGNLVMCVVEEEQTRTSLNLYHKLDKALGFYFFFIFASQQFAWIFSLYLSLSVLLHPDPDLITKFHGSFALLAVKSGGMFIISICCLFHLYHMVFEVETLRER